MFRTESLATLVAVAITMIAGAAGAQTIGELAEAQRAKLRQELAMKNAPAAVSAPTDVQAVNVAPVAPAVADAPRLRVHALYRRGSGEWVAEITNGFQLVKPVPGMVYGKYMLETVDGEGLHLKRVAKCARAKNCDASRVVRLGAEL